MELSLNFFFRTKVIFQLSLKKYIALGEKTIFDINLYKKLHGLKILEMWLNKFTDREVSSLTQGQIQLLINKPLPSKKRRIQQTKNTRAFLLKENIL